jgi:hypothetical protein
MVKKCIQEIHINVSHIISLPALCNLNDYSFLFFFFFFLFTDSLSSPKSQRILQITLSDERRKKEETEKVLMNAVETKLQTKMNSVITNSSVVTGSPLTDAVEVPDVAVVHWPCPDGLACELLLKDVYGASFPVLHYQHGVTILDEKWMEQFRGKNVWIADWCHSSVIALGDTAKSVRIWDHHATALPIEKLVLDSKKKNISMTFVHSKPCASVLLYRHLYKKESSIPTWLRIIDLHDTGRFDEMTFSDRSIHAALTDDLKLMEARRKMKDDDLQKIGENILKERQKEVEKLVPATLPKIHKVNTIHDSVDVIYLDVQEEKYIKGVTELFWTRFPRSCDILAIRKTIHNDDGKGGFVTDFKLRRQPVIDLSEFAKTYADIAKKPILPPLPGGTRNTDTDSIIIGAGGHPGAAGIQITNTSTIPNISIMF